MSESKKYASTWTFLWALGMAALTIASILLSEGHFVYTLDDPYIHLAVAENILRGGFGINLHEHSSPSSSVLYPFFLTATTALGLGAVGPFVLNGLAAGLSVWLLTEFFWRRVVPDGASQSTIIFASFVAPLLIFSINAFALPMTGMEHSLHVLAAIVTMLGLIAVVEGRAVSAALIFGAIALPFLRFEGMPLAISSVAILMVLGHWRYGLLIGAAIAVGLGAYAVLMHHLGLTILPSSVLLKSNVAATFHMSQTQEFARSMMLNLIGSFRNRWGLIFAVSACALLAAAQDPHAKWRSLSSPPLLIASTALVSLGAHLVAGRYGWFDRYEVYAVAMLVISGIYLMGPVLTLLNEKRFVAGRLGLVAALAIVVFPHIDATQLTPIASRNIYEQQYQMHRFATEFFPRRVAVNDLGWVSYGNDAYVLDLWGLGSEKVRRLRMTGRWNAKSISKLVEEADVEFAMIYKSWFEGSIPPDWCLMGVMTSQKVTAANEKVFFYSTKASTRAEMRAAISRYVETLPARVGFKKASCPSPRWID